jgi:hypothetical protein
MAERWESCPEFMCQRHRKCIRCRATSHEHSSHTNRLRVASSNAAAPVAEVVAPLSLTALRLVPDPFLATTEVRVHPEIIARVWKAFIETDLLRSAHPREKISLIVVSSAGDDVA